MSIMRRALCALLLVLIGLPAWAADRYWVGGTDTWNATAGTKWATSSGGAGGAAVPTASDNCFFDGNSGAVTVTGSAGNMSCLTLDATGFTGTLNLNGGNILLAGSLTLGSAMTFTTGGADLNFTASATITSNGTAISSSGGGAIRFSANSITIQLGDALTASGSNPIGLSSFSASNTVFQTNNHNISLRSISAVNSGCTITPGSSTITLLGAGTVINTITVLTSNTATWKITNNSATAKRWEPNSLTTWYHVWFNNNGTGAFEIGDTGTVGTLTVDTPPHTITVTAGKTITLSTWAISGTSGNLMTLQSSSAGSAFTLSDSSGTNTCDYCSIKDSTATGGATWNATNSTNVSGNTGWNFGGAAYAYPIIGIVVP